jgi:hypothetical protein
MGEILIRSFMRGMLDWGAGVGRVRLMVASVGRKQSPNAAG